MSANFEPVFVGGHMRSGTTLLRSLLDRHPRLAVANETYFVTSIADRLETAHRSHASLLQAWHDSPKCAGQGLDKEALQRRFESYPGDECHLFRAALEEYANQRGKDRCGEKTPDLYYRRPELLLKWYSNAKLILIVRDPRAIFTSILKMEGAFCKDPSTMGVLWADESRRSRNLVRKYPTRVRIVRYEDLLQDPSTHLTHLMSWLGLEFSPAQLDPAVATPLFYGSEKPHMAMASKPIHAGRADAWREELDRVHAARVTLAAGAELGKHGYVSDPWCLSRTQYLRGLLDRSIHSFLLRPYVRPIAGKLKRLCQKTGFNPDPWT